GEKGDAIIAVCNFTNAKRENYRMGMPEKGTYEIVFNSDLKIYGGNGISKKRIYKTENVPSHGQEQSVALVLPPLSTIYMKLRVEN
ncbi:MAG: alpha amylase C-terminal domain-containing protein, partial [Oscillospiraceae bacterium]|nr:alpha amylase C-terminal domain-containing protein [Oscillospiraceae bacterium]